MIYAMIMGAEGVAARLAARKFPFPVTYGPEHHRRESFHTTIVFERDADAPDLPAAPAGFQVNPRKVLSLWLACKCTIYAKSSLHAATVGEHEALALQLVEGVVTALDDWTSEGKTMLQLREMRFLRAEELQMPGLESWPGRAYQIKFAVGAGLVKRTFLGEARPTYTVAGFQNRTEARLDGAPDEVPPTIGCGEAP